MRLNLKHLIAGLLCVSALLPLPVLAEETSLSVPVKDHWDFESETSIAGDKSRGILNRATIEESGSEVFGKVLRFGSQSDQYMRLDNYIETGAGQSAFAFWYKYDTSISDSPSNAPTVLLQHEGSGKTILTLKADGHYNTYLNKTDVTSNGTVEKGAWQHVAVSFDQETKKVRYYINGQLDSEKDLGSVEIASGNLGFRVGAHKNAGTTDPHSMRGDIDELYVFKSALGEDDVRALYLDKALPLKQQEVGTLKARAEELIRQGVSSSHKTELENAMKAVEEAGTDYDALCAAITALSSAIDAAASSQPVTLTVSDTVMRDIEPSSVFGINHRYGFNGYGTFDPQKGEVREEFKELYSKAGFGSIRFPGGTISNLYNWKETIGPMESRTKQIHGFYNKDNEGGVKQTGLSANFGLTEIGNFADEMDSEIVYVYGLGRGNAQDASDLIEYLNADVGTNPNGGIDWAKVREENGHPEPYNVRFFEIGNEMDQCYGINTDGKSSQGYWILYRDSGRTVDAYTKGSDITCTEQYLVAIDDWQKAASVSDGQPGLVRYLRYANVNPKKYDANDEIVNDPEFRAVNDGVRIFVGSDSSKTEWTVVDSLENSAADAKHCVVDYSTGAVLFGDGVHGAIPPQGSNIYGTYKVHRDGFNDTVEAMRDTQAKIDESRDSEHPLKIYTCWENSEFVTLQNSLGKSDLYDGMTMHPYSGTVTGSAGVNFYADALKKADSQGIPEVQNLFNSLPAGKTPSISEFGIFRNIETQVRSQTHALYISKVLSEYLKTGTPYILKHCLADFYTSGQDALGPTQQAVIQVVALEGASTQTGEGNFGYFATPSAGVYEMLNSGFGSHLLESSLSSNPKIFSTVDSISTLASRDDEGNYSILVTNLDPENDLSLNLVLPQDATGTRVSVQRLESEAIDTENDLEHPDRVKVTESESEREDSLSFEIRKHSIALIRVYTPNDRTDLDNLIEQAEKLDASENVELKNRLSQARKVSENKFASRELIEKKTAQLEKAIEDATEGLLDYSTLEILINAQDDEHTFASSSAYDSALEQASTLLANQNAPDQAAIDAAVHSLHEADLNRRIIPNSTLLIALP